MLWSSSFAVSNIINWCMDIFPPFEQSAFCETQFLQFLHWSEGSGWYWAIANCDHWPDAVAGAQGQSKSVCFFSCACERVTAQYPVHTIYGHQQWWHGPSFLSACRSHDLPQTQFWLLYSGALRGRRALFQNAFLTQTSRLSRHATLPFSIFRIFIFRGSVAVQQSPESDLYKGVEKGKNYSFLLRPLLCLCEL